jgi:histidyl-tRNA synthetase
VYEVTADGLGSQNAIGAGGRYDNLVKDMGGPELGACGFALGLERIMLSAGQSQPETASQGVFIATMGQAAYEKGFKLADRIRAAGAACGVDHGSKSLKSQMRSADKMGARFVVIIGEDEIKKGAAVLRDMATKEQSEAAFDKIAEIITEKLNKG